MAGLTRLAPVPHRQVVLTLLNRLRACYRYRRRLRRTIARVAAPCPPAFAMPMITPHILPSLIAVLPRDVTSSTMSKFPAKDLASKHSQAYTAYYKPWPARLCRVALTPFSIRVMR